MAELGVRRVVAEGAEPKRWLAVLHGIYGSGRNWASVARSVVERRPAWGAALVDLREHGASTGFPPPHTLARTAADLDALEVPGDVSVLLGHSFGGKIALLRGRDDPGIDQLWIVDSTPEAAEPQGGAWQVLEIMRRLPDRFEDREAAVDALEREGIARPIGLWLSANLETRDGGYRWRIDLDDMEALLRDFFRTDLWELVESPREGLEIHFIRARDSSVLGLAQAERIRAAGRETGRVFLHDVAGGHWLNADNPDAVVDLLGTHLD